MQCCCLLSAVSKSGGFNIVQFEWEGIYVNNPTQSVLTILPIIVVKSTHVLIINLKTGTFNDKYVYTLKYVLRSSGTGQKSAALIVRYSQKKECIFLCSIVLRIFQLL